MVGLVSADIHPTLETQTMKSRHLGTIPDIHQWHHQPRRGEPTQAQHIHPDTFQAPVQGGLQEHTVMMKTMRQPGQEEIIIVEMLIRRGCVINEQILMCLLKVLIIEETQIQIDLINCILFECFAVLHILF